MKVVEVLSLVPVCWSLPVDGDIRGWGLSVASRRSTVGLQRQGLLNPWRQWDSSTETGLGSEPRGRGGGPGGNAVSSLGGRTKTEKALVVSEVRDGSSRVPEASESHTPGAVPLPAPSVMCSNCTLSLWSFLPTGGKRNKDLSLAFFSAPTRSPNNLAVSPG